MPGNVDGLRRVGVGLDLIWGYEKAESEDSEYRPSVVQNYFNASANSINNIALRYFEPSLNRMENFMTA